MEEMRELGAPALPAGHYYHVRSDSFGGKYVSIKKERKRLWDQTVAESSGRDWEYDDQGKAVRKLSPEEVIFNAAHAVHKSVYKTQPAERSWWEEFRKWEGDHK
jgi:hypothetical protein